MLFKNLRALINMMRMAEKQLTAEAQNRPRQIQNLTQTYSELIRRDFPEFDAGAFLSQAENTLVEILSAIEMEHLEVKPSYSEHLIQHVDAVILDHRSKNERWYFDDIAIHKSAINRYRHAQGSYEIDVDIALEYRYAIGNRSPDTPKTQHKYTIKAIYLQNKNVLGDGSLKGHNCPNCGAPVVKNGERTYCEYCQTGVTEINDRIWLFDSYQRG